MEWIDSITKAIEYIENNITDDLTTKDIANQVFISPIYFQKGFMILCGYSVSEYIKNRRLSLAGGEVLSTDNKIIDIAIKYGYDSPDSFTKAFTRFHGSTPTSVRKNGGEIKVFSSLKIKFTLIGGNTMNYKLIKKGSFKVVGYKHIVSLETSGTDIPNLWTKHYENGLGENIYGKYGVCIDESNMTGDKFEYMIADDFKENAEILKGCIVKEFPSLTWAVFSCIGVMPKSLQKVNSQIFSEWLPNCKEYEIASNYNIEMYTDTSKYPKGNQDENYYSEIWIPIKRK